MKTGQRRGAEVQTQNVYSMNALIAVVRVRWCVTDAPRFPWKTKIAMWLSAIEFASHRVPHNLAVIQLNENSSEIPGENFLFPSDAKLIMRQVLDSRHTIRNDIVSNI